MSSRTTGGTLAAWLIIAAILGFAGGAFFGLQSGGTSEPRTQTTSQSSGSGDSQDPDGDDDSDGSEESDSPNDESPSPDEAGDLAVDFSMSPTEVVSGEEGTINFEATVEPAEEGVVLRLERRVGDGGWEEFSDTVGPYVTNADGQVSSSIWSGREGPNHFRLVDNSDDSVVSNEVTVTVTE